MSVYPPINIIVGRIPENFNPACRSCAFKSGMECGKTCGTSALSCAQCARNQVERLCLMMLLSLLAYCGSVA